MKKTLLLILSIVALLLPLSANAEAPGLSPVNLELGLGWSETWAGHASNYYSGSESQGPDFFVGVKFRVAESLMLGVDASLSIQPWSYGTDYSYDYYDYSYSYDVSVKNRLFVNGDVTLTFYPVSIFYMMVGAGVTGMNTSYEAGYSDHGQHYDSVYSAKDGMKVGWNGMVAAGFQLPVAPFLRIGGEIRYTGGTITDNDTDELYDFSTVSAHLNLSFL